MTNELVLSPGSRRYGALQDVFDIRDQMSLSPVPGVYKPTQQIVDLRPWDAPIRDQKQEGACTMFAGTAIMHWLYKRFNGVDLIFSPQFGYRAERLVEGDPNVDGGAQSRTMMAVMHDTGLCLESTDPYVDTGWKNPTTAAMLAEAQKYRIGAYKRNPDLNTLRSILDSGYPSAIAIQVYESFESDSVAQTGMVPLPGKNEGFQGGHEVAVMGKDENRALLLVRNSWSAAWGDGGYFWLPYDYWTDGYVSDSWMAHLGSPWVPKTLIN